MMMIPLARKEAIIKQALNRGNKSLTEVAKENNVGYSTLHKWLRILREGGTFISGNKSINKGSLGHSHRFKHILATAHLDEVAIGAYCRKEGIFAYQLKDGKRT